MMCGAVFFESDTTRPNKIKLYKYRGERVYKFLRDRLFLLTTFTLALVLSCNLIYSLAFAQSTLPPSSSSFSMSGRSPVSTVPETTGETSSSSFIPYRNVPYGIEISYPEDWMVYENNNTAETGQIVSFVPPGEEDVLRYYVILRVNTYGAEENDDLSEIMENSINLNDESEEFTDWTVSEESAVEKKLGGYPAYDYTATYKQDGIDSKIKEMGLKFGGSEYDIVYLADADKFDKYLPVIQKMIDSFRLI
jgi:photosystem II reaction center protein PsbP